MKNYAIGVDIVGTKCSVVLGKGRIPDSGLEDFILDKICFPTEAAKGPEYTISNIIDAVYKVMQKNHVDAKNTVGIGKIPDDSLPEGSLDVKGQVRSDGLISQPFTLLNVDLNTIFTNG